MTGNVYLSYLLRLWVEGADENKVLRASLENTATGERIGFATVALLMEYLQGLPSTEIVVDLEEQVEESAAH